MATKQQFRFSITKASEAVAYLLNLAGGSLKIGQLGKFLYLADRRSLEVSHRPIIGDSYASLPRGPMVCVVYDLSKVDGYDKRRVASASWQEKWDRHFSRGPLVRLKLDAEPLELSPRELRILSDVYGQWSKLSWEELSRRLHDELPEWEDPEKSSKPISIEAMLSALGFKQQQIEDVWDQASMSPFGLEK
jgi:uncharacterized phage-associated protein